MIDVTVELHYSGAWQDITAFAYTRNSISIRRGVSNEGSRADPGELTLTLDNRDGRFSPRNPRGALYGLIGRNTPIRVSVGLAGEAQTVRFVGEVTSWPPRWDLSEADVYVPITAAGILRRLGTPSRPLRSTARRWLPTTSPAAYWSLDAGRLSTAGFITAGRGGTFRPFSGEVQFGAGDLGPWLEPGLELTEEATVAATVGLMSASEDRVTVDHVRRGEEGGTGPSVVTLRGASDGTEWIITATPDIFNEVEVQLNDGGSFVDSWGPTAVPSLFTNDTHHVRLDAQQNGADIDWALYVDGTEVMSDTATSTDLSGVGAVELSYDPGNDKTPLSWGHVAAWSGTPPALTTAVDAALGYTGETAGRRIERLCSEEGISLTTSGNLDETTPMGPQHPAELLELLSEAADAEAAGSPIPVLTERRTAAGLHLATRASLYNASADVTLDYAAGEVWAPLEPTTDDQRLANDVTVTRRDGGEAGAEQTDGPLSTQDPPDGVGRYERQVRLNLADDDQLATIAAWPLAWGTWDEDRIPALRVDMRGLEGQSGASAVANVAALDVPGRLVVANPPDWMPAHDIDQLVLGYSETIGRAEWTVDWHGVPYGPLNVFTLGDDVLGRLDTAGSELAAGVGASDTTLLVATDSGKRVWINSTDHSSHFPFALLVGGGEVVEVTGVDGDTSPQTFTVTRSVNGVSRSWDAGTRVRLARVAVSP